MARILIIDSCYPDFLKTVPVDVDAGYSENLRTILDRGFGTADFYSRNLRALGWDSVDVIANHEELQHLWMDAHGGDFEVHPQYKLLCQIKTCRPEIVFLQDLSVLDSAHINAIRSSSCPSVALIAGQCSCPWPGDKAIQRCDVIFTSFPHYVKRIEDLGVRAIYNPLAFDPAVLSRVELLPPLRGGIDLRIHDCVFIGGVGNPSHWRYGMEVLETVAREIPTFKWWGYGVDTLPADSALRSKYQGEAYGLDMYEILLQSKICLNRHGEVAEGYANNMRMFEATGCGALLLTEEAPNLKDFFIESNGVIENPEVVTYESPKEAVDLIERFLEHVPDFREKVAANGQARTLRDHTYAQRMKVVSETLKEMLCPA